MKISTSLPDNLNADEDNDVYTPASTEYSLSLRGIVHNEQDKINKIVDEEIETSSTVIEDNENKFYLEKINELATKVQQQSKIIKQKNAEIQRLRSTTIGNS